MSLRRGVIGAGIGAAIAIAAILLGESIWWWLAVPGIAIASALPSAEANHSGGGSWGGGSDSSPGGDSGGGDGG